MRVSAVLDKATFAVAKAIGRRSMAATPEVKGQALFEAQVLAVSSSAPAVRRITLWAPQFADLELAGPDEYFGLLMPGPSGELVLPDPERINIRAAVEEIPEEHRPVLRWYTVRMHRPQDSEIDVDIVTHGLSGPGSAWALEAAPGDRVGFRQCGALFLPPADCARICFVADETSAPAVAAIMENCPLSQDCRVIVETADLDHLIPLPEHPGVTIVERGSAQPGERVAATVASLDGAAEFDYYYLCGESSLATGCRRLLVSELGVDKQRVVFSGYWKLGQARV